MAASARLCSARLPVKAKLITASFASTTPGVSRYGPIQMPAKSGAARAALVTAVYVSKVSFDASTTCQPPGGGAQPAAKVRGAGGGLVGEYASEGGCVSVNMLP